MDSREGFRFPMVSCDGANTNRSAMRMLFTELHNRKTLLFLTHIFEAHAINNSRKWGLGAYSYWIILRLEHATESAKQWRVSEFVNTKIRPWEEIPLDPIIESDTAQDYFHCMARQPALYDSPTLPFRHTHRRCMSSRRMERYGRSLRASP